MPSENSITTTEPLRGARTRRPATAREPRPSFRSTTCTGVTLARSMGQSTGQLARTLLYGHSQVREMSADVVSLPKAEDSRDPEQRSRHGEVVEVERHEALGRVAGFNRLKKPCRARGPAVTTLRNYPQARLARSTAVVAVQLQRSAGRGVKTEFPGDRTQVRVDAGRDFRGLAGQGGRDRRR